MGRMASWFFRACTLVGSLLVLPSLAPGATPEQQFSDVKVYGAEGKPWRVPVEDWAGAKQRVASDPQWAGWLKRERAAVDDWMAHQRDRVAWECGWFHDFVSPKDASHVTWEPKVPGEEAPDFHSPSDPHIAITPKLMGGWVFEFRTKHAGMMVRAAELFRLTGEQKYADWAAAQLDFYTEHYLEWKPAHKDQGARIFWQDLDEATFGIKYADTVRLLGDSVAPARRSAWHEKLFSPIAEVMDHDRRAIHNIANWQRCAEAEFALVFHDDALWRRAIDGRYGVREQIAKGVTADAIWFEQSFHYNEFVVEALLTLFTAAGLEGRAAELAPEMATAENLMLSPLYLRFPDSLLPNPADGTGIETAPHRPFLADAVRIFPTTLGLAEAAHRRDWNTLLDPPAPPPRPDTLPEVTSRSLEASRMAVLKRGGWQVFFHYGQLVASHAQSEALNYSASYGATDITHDPGTVGYGSPFHKDYYTQGLNHNVPLIAGTGETAPQAGKLLTFSAGDALVAAEQPQYNKNSTARRTLQVDGDRLTDSATIATRDGSVQPLGLALHVQGKVRLPAEFKATDAFAKDRPASFGYWKNVTTATYRDRATFTVEYTGGVTMSVTLAVPGEFTIWHGSTPDVPPKRREGFYLETRGTSATFTTTFAPVKE